MNKWMVLLMVCAGAAQAELLVGNTSVATNGSRVVVGEYGLGENYPVLQARSITTGAEAYTLTSIYFGEHLYHDSGSGDIRVSVHANNGSTPGNVIAGGGALFTATAATVGQPINANGVVTLAANATYWFVTSADQSLGATRYWWNLSNDGGFASDGAGFGMPLSNANDALGWTTYGGEGPLMDVYGEAVPEPATMTLMGLGGLGSWLARRKRQRRLRRRGPTFEELHLKRTFIEEEQDAAPFGGRREELAYAVK